MDQYSILDQSSSAAAAKPAPVKEEAIAPPAAPVGPPAPTAEALPKTLQFPGEDGGRSLAEMAERDLEMTLQLLAERAHYITGATGAAIALRHGEEMICRASAGPAAPEVGAQLQVNSGLTGESVRTRQLLRCDDSSADTRVNRESCQALGIASVVVMPLVHEDVVNGVFELLSGRSYAFEERDIIALQRLGEMVQTAVEHAQATAPVEEPEAAEAVAGPIEVVAAEVAPGLEPEAHEEPPVAIEEVATVAVLPAVLPVPPPVPPPVPIAVAAPVPIPAPVPAPEIVPVKAAAAEDLPADPPKMALGHIGKCKRCGFPVSEGRTQCLDCDAAHGPDKSAASVSSPLPFTYGEEEEVEDQRGWLRRNAYWIGMVLVTAATIAMLVYVRM